MPPKPRPRSARHLSVVPKPPARDLAQGLRAQGPRAAAVKVAAGGGAKAGGPIRGDWLWSGLGLGAATASAGFATYAMIFSTGQVVPSGDFNLFARYDRLYQTASSQRGAPAAGTDPRRPGPPPARADLARADVAQADLARADAVDFTPTGSLASPSDRSRGDGLSGQAGRERPSPEGRPLPGFTLRDVFDGKALVESRSSLSVVKPGSVLDGAGEVLSIERRGERWVVLTANGVIAGQRR